VAVVDAGGDLGSPVDNTEPAAVGILPVDVDFGEEGLKSGVVLVLIFQGVLRTSQGRLVLLGRAQLRLQVLDLSDKTDGVMEPRRDGVLDLGHGTSKTVITANEDVLRVGPVKLVMGRGVDGGDVFAGEAEDPLARVAAARLNLLEQEREGALRVVGLPGDGNA